MGNSLNTHVKQKLQRSLFLEAQTPLIQFVVDLLHNKLYNKSKANPQQTYNESRTNRNSTPNPQHLDMSRCCGFIVDSTVNPQQIELVEFGFRQVVDLWRCSQSQ